MYADFTKYEYLKYWKITYKSWVDEIMGSNFLSPHNSKFSGISRIYLKIKIQF